MWGNKTVTTEVPPMNKIGWRLVKMLRGVIGPPFRTREVNDTIKVQVRDPDRELLHQRHCGQDNFFEPHRLKFRKCLFIVSEKEECHRVEAGERKGKGLSGNENSD